MKIKTILALLFVLALVACAQPQKYVPPPQAPPPAGYQPPAAAPPQTSYGGNGHAVFTVADAAADMGAVTSVNVTIDSVQVHSASEGWVTVTSTAQTVDLLKLKAEGSQMLLADVNLTSGTYEQMRLEISQVVVTDANGSHEAKLPSGELKFIGDLTVEENATSIANFDFIADESLHITGNGQYILAPVVKVETKEDAEVEVMAGGKVSVKGGKVKTSAKFGMDADGNVGVGLKIGQDEDLEIDGGMIKVRAKGIMNNTASGKVKTSVSI